MKKTVRVLCAFMIVTMLMISLSSCGKAITGKYSADFMGTVTTYEFGLFGKVTKTVYIPATIISKETTTISEGKYEIVESEENPGNLIITLQFEGEDATDYSFVQGEENGTKYIEIGLMRYIKE